MESTKKPFQIGVVVGAVSDESLENVNAQNIALVLYANAVGLMLCPVGVVVLVLSLVLRARARQGVPPPLPPASPF